MIRWERKLLVVTRHIRFRRIRQVEWTDDWRRWAGEVVLGGAREEAGSRSRCSSIAARNRFAPVTNLHAGAVTRQPVARTG